MVFNDDLEKVIEHLKEFNISTIYLFGSFNKGEERIDSDVDLAFLSNDNIDEYTCFMKAQELAEIFKRDVDLIDLKKITTVFKAQIIGTAKVIYCNDNSKRAYFEIKSLKEYALLNEERREILDKIKESGIVYGKGCSL